MIIKICGHVVSDIVCTHEVEVRAKRLNTTTTHLKPIYTSTHIIVNTVSVDNKELVIDKSTKPTQTSTAELSRMQTTEDSVCSDKVVEQRLILEVSCLLQPNGAVQPHHQHVEDMRVIGGEYEFDIDLDNCYYKKNHLSVLSPSHQCQGMMTLSYIVKLWAHGVYSPKQYVPIKSTRPRQRTKLKAAQAAVYLLSTNKRALSFIP